jgi:gamma-glutamylcyclotransferase (GGCT)/AIG2-like uncharacterized protein YtfP
MSHLDHSDTDRMNDVQLRQKLEIVTDPYDSNHVWIYMLDDEGDRVEGAEFSMDQFMLHVLKFYNDNY